MSTSERNFARDLRRGALTVAAALGLGAANAHAQCGPPGEADPPLRDSMLVTVPWLAEHLHDRGLVILHIEMQMGNMPAPRAYDTGHIPGARFASAHSFDPSADSVPALLASLGISPDDRVVIYGDPWMKGRALLALASVGLTRVAFLDGGLTAWRAAGNPVATTATTFARTRYHSSRPRVDLTVDRAWVQAHLRDPAVTILDVRSQPEYLGMPEQMTMVNRPGHIPGAWHLDWTSTFADSAAAEHGRGEVIKPVRALRAQLRSVGVHQGQTVVVYCTVGMRASYMLWLLRYLGYDARIYQGSMSDWSNNSTLPVVSGDARGTP